MPHEINLSISLLCHHGHWDDFIRDARVIQRVGFEKGLPITFFFSGMQIDAFAHHRDSIHSALWFDVVGALQGRWFINPRWGDAAADRPEVGIMPYHHVPLVHPWAAHLWGDYFQHLVGAQMQRSIEAAQRHFGKTPVTAYPPDGVYAAAAAHCLRSVGLDTVVVSSEFLGGDRHAKGILYWASGLRHAIRTNDIQPQAFLWASDFVNAVESYGHEHDVPFVNVSCDIDEFNGMRVRSLRDGVAYLCWVGDEVKRRNMKLVNVNAAAHWDLHQAAWPFPWDNVHAEIDADGGLGFLDGDKNPAVGEVLWLMGERYRQGFDAGRLAAAGEHLCMAADIACRNRYFGDGLNGYFWGNIHLAKEQLLALR